jgi:hypothetical protein
MGKWGNGEKAKTQNFLPSSLLSFYPLRRLALEFIAVRRKLTTESEKALLPFFSW